MYVRTRSFFSVFLLTITENGILHRVEGQSMAFVNLLFEVVSAQGTVGLSVNLTPQLTSEGKCILIFNMRVPPGPEAPLEMAHDKNGENCYICPILPIK